MDTLCNCGCTSCPTVVWDLNEAAPDGLDVPSGTLDWARANGIDSDRAAREPVQVVRWPNGRHEIQWIEVLQGPASDGDDLVGASWVANLVHEWGANETVGRRRSTTMTEWLPELRAAEVARTAHAATDGVAALAAAGLSGQGVSE